MIALIIKHRTSGIQQKASSQLKNKEDPIGSSLFAGQFAYSAANPASRTVSASSSNSSLIANGGKKRITL